MSAILRIELIIFSIIFLIVVFRAINKKKLWLQHSLVWIFISFSLILISVFPQIVLWLSDVVKIETPSNLVYLFGIIALLIVSFLHSIVISSQANKIKKLVQMLSIENYSKEREKISQEIDYNEEIYKN
ncbi:DUF2304 domain-containing protein [Paraclostridium sordellii]|uniref:Uncharacterized conserved protein n=1 Tax=Paraclostridium sordellii TaxID=1505 RepID=A0A0C7QD34_PARSO|nr:DUF2304 domain-containing protein [Paeniclostridium sordellii]CEN79729.1 Uncharacterized conserved protein [[Clostridium] sordellii] [Paeniclostridium sordellii]CEO12174.1 Uncharacterized conserved protein [[Clostridium] sordellii] [Paeniclostridium sordellii]CEP87776.1 Uncharacterized conserved protein [[Clostridium] sordellii] [Paeniclostridium sordellii]CEP97488.1 Uncharacterized conserved protein [[Clostridium] sordellii] [Paeniclostridium sordellii]CEQ01176.1 Uncharacterized conserved 